MTAVAEQAPKSKAPRAKAPPLAGDPTVQLLPPSIRDRAKNREFRRLMVMLIILAVVVVAGGVAYGLYRSVQAQVSLTAAYAETARLMAEQETYRADAAVADVVAATEEAQQIVTTTEVDWQQLLDDIDGSLSSKTDVTAVAVTTPLPWSSAPVSPGLLRPVPTVVASITVTGPKVANIADLTARLSELPGFVEAYFDSASATDTGFATTMIVAFDQTRFLGRYAPVDQAPAPAETGAPVEEVPAPAVTDAPEGVQQ